MTDRFFSPKNLLWFAFFVGLLTTQLHAQTAGAPQQVTSVEGITEYRLANGLQLLLVPDNSKASTTVNVTYRVGSRHENYGETGMAHLLEHLIFKGTPTTPNAWAEFTKRGLRANGTTWYDRTNYFASFSANEDTLNWYLGWQADAMVNSFIARKDLDTEMTVVRNEMESNENSAGRMLMQRLTATMYEWHNYGKDTIGARSDIENVDITRLQAFYRQHYQPDNATLIVAGRFDSTKVLARVMQVFGPLPKPTRTLPPTYTLDPAQDGERQVTLKRVGGTPIIIMGHHLPSGAHPDSAAAALLTQVLGDAPGGRLHKALVEKQLAAGAFAFSRALAEPGQLFAGVQLAPGQDPAKARAEVEAVLDDLLPNPTNSAPGAAKAPVTAEELERARRQWLNSWEQGFADPETVGVAISDAISTGDWRLYFLRRDQVRAVTLADVQRVATERLLRDNRTVGIYLPTATPQRAPAPARTDVAALLQGYKGDANAAQAETFDASPANLEARTQRARLAGAAQAAAPQAGAPQAGLPGGLQLALLPKGTRGRTVKGQLALHWGSVTSLQGQGLTADMLGAVIDKGVLATAATATNPAQPAQPAMSRQQVADAFDALRAQVSFSANGQTLYVGFSTVREHTPALLQLLGRVLQHPSLPQDALDEARAQWLTGLEDQKRDPSAVAGNAAQRHGNPYPRTDIRYARSFDEMEADIKAVTPAALQAYHRKFVSAAFGELALAGDIDAAAVRAAAQAAFGGWLKPADGTAAYTRAPKPSTNAPAARLVFNTPDKQNAHLSVRVPLALTDRDADHPRLLLAVAIFGGGTNSRLWLRIREREGLSYGVGAGTQWNQFETNSMLTGGAIFAPQNQSKVEKAFAEELARSLKDGFAATELAEAKAGLLNERRLERAQDDSLAPQLAGQMYLGRSYADEQRLDDALTAATLAEVNAAWRKHVSTQRLLMVWAGDFKAP
jgi:zinc protease